MEDNKKRVLNKSINCEICFLDKPKHKIKRIRKKWVCVDCYKEGKKKNRDYLIHEVLGRRRITDLKKEWAEKRKQKELEEKLIKKPFMFEVKGEKRIKISRQLHFYLTHNERQVLYKKYISQGLDSKEANLKVNADAEYLSNFVRRVREEKKSEEEVNKNFKEEFSKLISPQSSHTAFKEDLPNSFNEKR